jgi:hypothetical protein
MNRVELRGEVLEAILTHDIVAFQTHATLQGLRVKSASNFRL